MPENPIDIFKGEMPYFDLRTRYYLMRPVIGKINAMMIGDARRVISSTTITTGGVDDPIVKMLNGSFKEALNERDPIWGFDAARKPGELISSLKSIKTDLILAMNPTDEDWSNNPVATLIGDLNGTLDYLCQPRVTVLGDKLVALALQLGVPEKLLVDTLNDQNAKSAARLQQDRHAISALINSHMSIECEFESLPTTAQIGIYESIDKTLDTSFRNALSTVLRPDNRMGDIPVIQSMKKLLKEWSDFQSRTNPDFAMLVLGF